ncbi:hypothetical protein D3C80_1676670 [compost metagenome]
MGLRVIPAEVHAVDHPEVRRAFERSALDLIVPEIEDQTSTEQWHTLSSHVALPRWIGRKQFAARFFCEVRRVIPCGALHVLAFTWRVHELDNELGAAVFRREGENTSAACSLVACRGAG